MKNGITRLDYWVMMLFACFFFFVGTSFLGILLGRIVFISLGFMFPDLAVAVCVMGLSLIAFKLIKRLHSSKESLLLKIVGWIGVLATFLIIVTCIGGVILHLVQTEGVFEEIIPFETTGNLLSSWIICYVVAFIFWGGKEYLPKAYEK